MLPTLLVFLKAPAPGFVKTRLAATLGPERAAEAYVAMSRAIRAELETVRGIRLRWVYAPRPEFPGLDWLGPRDPSFWEQGRGGLGARLARAFERAFREDGGPVCVIGMDSPGLRAARFREAFRALARHDLVIGPTEDGGYYLLGLAERRPEIFRGIPWSSSRVFERTVVRAKASRLRTKLLPEYFDVDTPADYARWLMARRRIKRRR